MNIKVINLAETQTLMDIGPHDEALGVSGFRNLQIETEMNGGYLVATFEVVASINRPYPVKSYLPAQITEGDSVAFEGYIAPKYPKRRWDGGSQSLAFMLYGWSGHFAELPTVGLYIDAGTKHSTFVTDWIHGGVNPEDYGKGDPYLQCSAGDIRTTDTARTSPLAFADGATWRDILEELCLDEDWEWGIYEGKLLFFRPKHTTIDYYVYLSDTAGEMDDPYGEVCDLVIAPYRPAFGANVSHTWYPDTGFDPPADRLGVRRYLEGTGNLGIDQVNTQAQTYYDFYQTARVTGPLTVRKLYDANGIEVPTWNAKAGKVCALQGRQPHEAVDSFRIQRTVYDHNTGRLTLERELPATTFENLLSRIGD